jgi:hypothetical protein
MYDDSGTERRAYYCKMYRRDVKQVDCMEEKRDRDTGPHYTMEKYVNVLGQLAGRWQSAVK